MKIPGFSKLLRPSSTQGWYLLKGEQTFGPVSAERLAEIHDHQQYFISKRGLSQWYPLKEFVSFFQNLEDVGSIPNSSSMLGLPAEEASALSNHRVSNPLEVNPRPKVRSKLINALKEIERPETSSSALPSQDAGLNFGMPNSERAFILRPRPERIREMESRVSKLRVGEVRSFGFSKWPLFFVSFGLSWVNWFSVAHREVEFHLKHNISFRYYPLWICALPMIHFWATYELATMIVRMERQNSYQSIHPGVAAVLSVFPPFAMSYLQRAMNRHWLAHLQSEWHHIR